MPVEKEAMPAVVVSVVSCRYALVDAALAALQHHICAVKAPRRVMMGVSCMPGSSCMDDDNDRLPDFLLLLNR
ncbi:MAG: hypothetical protein Q9M31_00615 [Mariprofundus sp.]|nr:hypothetical protein [Mariprofundus sp.]